MSVNERIDKILIIAGIILIITVMVLFVKKIVLKCQGRDD